MKSALIYTDLDGTLLDHHTYSAAAAQPTFAILSAKGLPVIPCTSKTYAETRGIANDLNFDGPMIIENGAAVWIPDQWGLSRTAGAQQHQAGWIHCFGASRKVIRRQLAILSIEWGNRYQSLCDLTDQQVAALTGLDIDKAALAKDRHHSETLVWLGTPADRLSFAEQVEALDLQCVQGGRFVHVLDSSGKAEAMSWLHQKVRRELPDYRGALSVAAGDADNDREMLEVADLALLVRSPVHEPPYPNRTRGLVISDQMGPAGWAEGIEALLARIEEEESYGRFLPKRHDNNAA